MVSFKFKAKKLDGQEIEGVRLAEDRYGLAKDLRKEGYILIDFNEEGKKKKFNLSVLRIGLGRVSLSEKMIFTRNLAVMVSAGLALSKAITILIKQTKSLKFKKVLSEVSNSLIKGSSLSDSLAKHEKIFPKLYISMVTVGESSGKLDKTLKLVAEQMEKDLLLRKKVKGALIYPFIIVLAMIGIGILMLIYVVPTLTSTFEELGVDLPISTRIIVWFSNSLIANSLIIISVLFVFVITFIFFLRKSRFKKIKDKLFLKIPLIAPLVQKINTARTARTLSSLVSAGVDILDALTTTSNVVQNLCYKEVLINAKNEIQKGSPLSESFKQSQNVYPLLLGEMIAVGEETGKLSEMLLQLAVFYEEEVSQATKDMTTVIEPILMVFIGVVVGFFAISMIKPMYSMVGSL